MTGWSLPPRYRALALVAAGVGLETTLALGFLRPFFFGAHPEVVRTYQPPATLLGPDRAGALRFVMPTLIAFAAYALALWSLRGLPARLALPLVLAGTLTFALTLLPINPVGAQDVYHNIADARTYWLHGANPTRTPPDAFPADPFLPHVFVWQEYPSSYGPLWYQLAGAPLPLAGAGLWENVLGQKLLITLFLLGTVTLAMRTARLYGGDAATAGLLVGWNPLLQFATAGNAHNDIAMVFFALASLYAAGQGWWLAVFPLLALSVACKHVLVLLVPLALVWLLRRPTVPRRTVTLSLALGVLLAATLYAPLLAGRGYARFREEGTRVTSSPGVVLVVALQRFRHLDPEAAERTMRRLMLPPFLLGYLVLLWRAARAGRPEGLARAAFWAVFLFLVLAKWWFWPWYVVWLVPLAALLPRGRPALVVVAASLGAMLAYVPFYWQAYGDWERQQVTTAATAFLAPVLLAVAPRVPCCGWHGRAVAADQGGP